jgi:hypothetical protein
MMISKNAQKKKIKKIEKTKKSVNSREGVRKMFFDGASSCDGGGAGVLFVSLRPQIYSPFRASQDSYVSETHVV